MATTLLQQTVQAYLEEHHPNWEVNHNIHTTSIHLKSLCRYDRNGHIRNDLIEIYYPINTLQHFKRNSILADITWNNITLLPSITQIINKIDPP